MQNIQEAIDYVYENLKNNPGKELFHDKEYLRAIMEQMVLTKIPELLSLEELQKFDKIISDKNIKESDFIENIPQYPQILNEAVKDIIMDYISGPQEEDIE